MARSCGVAVVILLTIVSLAGSVQAQTTEFIYQGQLLNASAPANGNFDFEFLLFDSLAGGAQVGSTLTKNGVAVAGGLFSVKLDFGSNYPGANRFLEIHVRQSGGGAFTPLTPRQAISSSPYSIKSLSADNALNSASLGGLAANQYVLTNDSRLSDARNPLPGDPNYLQNTTNPQAGANFNIDGNGTVGGNLIANGNLGVGVPVPTQKLQVAGVIQSTTGGIMFPDATTQVTAAAGAINRVIRGVITFSGSNFEASQNFSPVVDPTKSVVIISNGVANFSSGNGCTPNIREATLISLDSNTVTIAFEKTGACSSSLLPIRVGYQVIEYK